MHILGIESSCDETAAAVVRDGRTVLSSIVASQVEEHKLYGGVVPEIASRRHAEAISGVVRQALEHSKVPYEIMCFPWQCPFLHGYIGPRAQLREISMTDLEAAPTHLCKKSPPYSV